MPASVGAAALESLSRLPEGDRVCHGDFHRANVVLCARGARVIDWPNATMGDPHADVASATLIVRIADVDASSPWMLRRLSALARGALLRSYLTAYERVRPLDHDRVRAWMLPVAAERLAQGVTGERERLLASIAALRD